MATVGWIMPEHDGAADRVPVGVMAHDIATLHLAAVDLRLVAHADV
jgi:hypothetical protein